MPTENSRINRNFENCRINRNFDLDFETIDPNLHLIVDFNEDLKHQMMSCYSNEYSVDREMMSNPG